MSTCQCNPTAVDAPAGIAPGLAWIPRQCGRFGDFRDAMLAQVRRYPALAQWKPCGPQDFGLMLLEMWAYVLDVQAFYDAVLAQEAYLGTARQRASLRKLTALLGHVPRPAVAASVHLALLAEGRRDIRLKAGATTSFRSAAFDSESPQVFELSRDTIIHPLNNQWAPVAPVSGTLAADGTTGDRPYASLLLRKESALKKDDLVRIQVQEAGEAYDQVRRVTAIGEIWAGGQRFKRVTFDTSVQLKGSFAPADIRIQRSTQTGGLWTQAHISGDPKAIDDRQVVLDGLYRRIKAGDGVVLEKAGSLRGFRVETVTDVSMTLSAAVTRTVQDSEDNDVVIAVPAVTAPVTRLALTGTVQESGWTHTQANQITLHYAFQEAAQVAAQPAAALTADTSLQLDTGQREDLEVPQGEATAATFLLRDKNLQGTLVTGRIDYAQARLEMDPGAAPTGLRSPVTVFGNVVGATRGESVRGEVLGSGDATLANQFFALRKGPLTYLNSPTSTNEQGVSSTLRVYVDGVAWREVPSFYDAGPTERVYVVRQNDDHQTMVMFGDGRCGARLPSGSANIIADYRFGAGRAAPPAGCITQMARSVKGIRQVIQVLDAQGGGDAESGDDLRRLAPRSALLLGRVVSMEDMQVAAESVPGVTATHAEWRWQALQQRPVVQIRFLGDADPALVKQKITNLTSGATPLAVTPIMPFPLGLSIELAIEADRLDDEVLAVAADKLLGQPHGTLLPANLGFGRPIFRSRLFADLLSVPGVWAVKGLLIHFLWWQLPWSDPAIPTPDGYVWDFSSGGVRLNGKEF